jgi:ribosomal protein S18 acetylase RimI-like enzyme
LVCCARLGRGQPGAASRRAARRRPARAGGAGTAAQERPLIALRPATEADAEFLFALLKEALGVYVVQTYGPWDEADQRVRFFAAEPTRTHQVVECDGEPVGCLAVRRLADEVRLDRIFLLRSCQGRGIGSRLIRDVLAEADAAGLPVRLQVMKANPAQRLYRRLGFRVTGESATHVRMERPAPA